MANVTDCDGSDSGDEAAPRTESVKSALPRILSCSSVMMFAFCEGLSYSTTSSLIPQLQETGEIPITLEQGVFIGSVMVAAMCVGTFFTSVLMNRLGRLHTVRISLLPFSVGFFLVAVATSYEMILAGRVLTGIANAVGFNAAAVFTTEVASSRTRGALNALNPTMASLGIVVSYVLGALTDWRTSAWLCGASPALTLGLMWLFCHESPMWLVSRGRHEDALRSLRAYARGRDSEHGREKLPQLELEELEQWHAAEQKRNEHALPWYLSTIDVLRTPAGYKPLITLTAIFLAQNFSGIYITLYFAATFFQEMGVQLDVFQAAIYVGVVRVLAGMAAVVLIQRVGVRTLMVVSSLGMAVCMLASGYFTLHPELGYGGWVAVGCVLAYVASSCCGLLTVPWTMTAELFPDRLRDAGQCLSVFIADVATFAALELYPILNTELQGGSITGSVGLQWFFAAVCLANVVYVVLFLPETRGRTLQEIEQHYQLNTMWLCRKRPLPASHRQNGSVPSVSSTIPA